MAVSAFTDAGSAILDRSKAAEPIHAPTNTLTITILLADPHYVQCEYQWNADEPTDVPMDIQEGRRTRLDLNLVGKTGARIYDCVMVRILLSDSLAYFDPPPNGGGPLLCATSGNKYAAAVMRDLSAYQVNAQGNITGIQFYVMRSPYAHPSPYGLYNLKIWIADKKDATFVMATIFDPGIKNDG